MQGSISVYRRSVINVRPYSVSSYEIELCLRTDSAEPLARSYCLAIRALGKRPRFQPLCVPVGMEFVAALMAALHQIEDDPNHKGRISLPNSLVLTCEPPQYVIGDGMAACFVFPVLDNLSKAGWSWGCVSAVDSRGRTIFVEDAHRGSGKRFIVVRMKS